MRCLKLHSKSRLLLVAPHPDDETLACGVILQRAVAAGAQLRVIYATDGENNPWPQRYLERKWRIKAKDRVRWGELRRREALAALNILGVGADQVEFLALPDQGLTNLLWMDCARAAHRLDRIIGDWAPDYFLIPSHYDTHPDHSALAVLFRLALGEFRRGSSFSYLVHGRSKNFFAHALPIVQTAAEMTAKREAILCHRTQIVLSRRRFLDYAGRNERLFDSRQTELGHDEGAIREVKRNGCDLSVRVAIPISFGFSNHARLLVVGRDTDGVPCCFEALLPARSSRIEVVDYNWHKRLEAIYVGNAFAGRLQIALKGLSIYDPVFLKLERRSSFFDQTGWIEVPPIRVSKSPPTSLTKSLLLSR